MNIPDGRELNPEREQPQSIEDRKDITPEEYLTPEEAASELGVSVQELEALAKQYGIGRYHLPEPGRQIVFSRGDVEGLQARRT